MPAQNIVDSPARALVSRDEFTAVQATVRSNNPGMSEEVAARIVAEALAFVATCATSGRRGLRPSRIVDEGWHALILHTRTYAALCERLGRNFVHHVPELPDVSRYDSSTLDATQEAITAAGYPTDALLWLPPTDETIPVAASCQHSPGGPEGTCTGDGGGDAPSGPNFVPAA